MRTHEIQTSDYLKRSVVIATLHILMHWSSTQYPGLKGSHCTLLMKNELRTNNTQAYICHFRAVFCWQQCEVSPWNRSNCRCKDSRENEESL
jgi:hypothetical protein